MTTKGHNNYECNAQGEDGAVATLAIASGCINWLLARKFGDDQ